MKKLNIGEMKKPNTREEGRNWIPKDQKHQKIQNQKLRKMIR